MSKRPANTCSTVPEKLLRYFHNDKLPIEDEEFLSPSTPMPRPNETFLDFNSVFEENNYGPYRPVSPPMELEDDDDPKAIDPKANDDDDDLFKKPDDRFKKPDDQFKKPFINSSGYSNIKQRLGYMRPYNYYNKNNYNNERFSTRYEQRQQNYKFQDQLDGENIVNKPRFTKKEKQITYNRNVMAVLAVTTQGYTLANALKSISEDGIRLPNVTIAKEINDMHVNTLFVVDDYTEKKWMDIKTSNEIMFKNVKSLRIFPPSMDQQYRDEKNKCIHCKNSDCHRWRATVMGIARILKLPVTVIKH